MTKATSNSGGLNISNWSFTLKFMTPAAVGTALLAALAFGAVLIMNGQEKAIDNINNKSLPEAVKFGDIKSQIKEANGTLWHALADQASGTPSSSKVNALTADLGKIAGQVKAAGGAATDEEQKKKLSDLNKEINSYKDGIEFAGSVMEVDFKSVSPMMEQFDASYAKMSTLTDDIINSSVANAKKAATEAKAAQATGVTLLTIFAAVMAALSCAVAFIFAKTTVAGINRIARTTQELANGNLGIDISSLARGDELKSVVDSLNVFKSNAEEKNA